MDDPAVGTEVAARLVDDGDLITSAREARRAFQYDAHPSVWT